MEVQKPLEDQLKREHKEKIDLEAKLLIRGNTVRALKKAMEVEKLREVRKLIQKVHNPKGMCSACLYRAMGRVGGRAHTYERGNCRYRSKGVVWE